MIPFLMTKGAYPQQLSWDTEYLSGLNVCHLLLNESTLHYNTTGSRSKRKHFLFEVEERIVWEIGLG